MIKTELSLNILFVVIFTAADSGVFSQSGSESKTYI